MNQFSLCTRRQRRAPAYSFLAVLMVLATALVAGPAHANGTLTISGTPAGTIKAGTFYSFTPTVKDSLTGRTLYFNIGFKPSWATFDETTGKLSGTPTAANVGKYSNIGILVNDKINAAVLTAFSITVTAGTGGTTPAPPTTGKAPLTISGTPASTATVGTKYTFTPTVVDTLTGRTLYFNIGYKPSWATFNSSTGQLTGTPTAADVGKFSNIGITVNDKVNAAVLTAFSITVSGSGGTAPGSTVKISGTPATSITAGSAYHFQPTATDSAGRAVSFSVQNKPVWATFSISSGLLSGTPTASQTGTYSNIVVTASDGTASSALAPFNIAVTGTAPPATTGAATLYWTDPSHNTDGSALTNFGGIRIYYGTSSSNLSHVVQIPGNTATTYTVSNLAAGTWYFGATAYNTVGAESGLSKIGSKTVQ